MIEWTRLQSGRDKIPNVGLNPTATFVSLVAPLPKLDKWDSLQNCFVWNKDKMDTKNRIIELCKAAKKQDEVYFLLTMGLIDPSNFFYFSDLGILYRLVSEYSETLLACSKTKLISVEVALNLYQKHIEASAFYTILINLANVILGKKWENIPYQDLCLETKKGKLRIINPSTSAIIQRTVKKLKQAGFADVAIELENTHKLKPYRNVYAHSKFMLDDVNRKLIVGQLELINQKVVLKSIDIPYAQVNQDFKGFFLFREESLHGINLVLNEYKDTDRKVNIQRFGNDIEVNIRGDSEGRITVLDKSAIPLW